MSDSGTHIHFTNALPCLRRLRNTPIERARDPELVPSEVHVILNTKGDQLSPAQARKSSYQDHFEYPRLEKRKCLPKVPRFKDPQTWSKRTIGASGELGPAQHSAKRIPIKEFIIGGRGF